MVASSRDLSEEQCRGIEMTSAQSEVFLAVDEFWKRYGYAPSLGDIAFMRGRVSKGNTKRLVDSLVALGVLKYLANKKRSVRPVYLNFRNIQ
jgi:SOS-response transcriptional repressor LexA